MVQLSAHAATRPLMPEHRCVVCLVRAVTLVLVPYGHVLVCQSCSGLYGPTLRYPRCSVCDVAIAQVIKLHYATPEMEPEREGLGSDAASSASETASSGPNPWDNLPPQNWAANWAPGQEAEALAWERNNHGGDIRYYAVWSLGGDLARAGVHAAVGASLHQQLTGIYAWRDINWRRCDSMQAALLTYVAEAHHRGAPQRAAFHGL